MDAKRKVLIKNIFHMFKYIWDNLDKSFNEISFDNKDDFESADILCDLFLINIKEVIRFSFYKEYIEQSNELRGIKGKINVRSSLNNMSFNKAKVFCDYEEMEINNPINQIIKTTTLRLHRLDGVNNEHKKKLNQILLYLNQVEIVNITSRSFNIKFNRINKYTSDIIDVCKLIHEMTMISDNQGRYKFINILDDNQKMQKYFELFICKFYKKHLSNNDYKVTHQKQLKWNFSGGNLSWIPAMRLDVQISSEKDTVIIDTKYYKNYYVEKTYGIDYKDKKIFTSNIYQMFSYMNNISNSSRKIRGILLYPTPLTRENIDECYNTQVINNDTIIKASLQVKTLDLSLEWKLIEKELLQIIHMKQDYMIN